MKILLSNDDGVHATGLNFLKTRLEKDHDIIVIAPDQERSSCGHAITLGEPIRVSQLEENVYSCSGKPADCVLVGLGNICKDDKPDLIISGINHGPNLGQDRYYSGTIAAAREGAFRGIPSIAVSLVTNSIKDMEHFDVAADYIAELVAQDIKSLIPENTVMNVNVPNLPKNKIAGSRYTTTGFQQYSDEVIERVDGRGKSYFWLGGTYQGSKDIAGSDCNAVTDGFISVNLQSLIGRECDDVKVIESLKAVLGSLQDEKR